MSAMQLPLGEVIAWMSKATSQAALVAGLKAGGLDPALARDFLPRHAFSRALRKMEKNRVIRQVSEDKTHILFQFTSEAKIGDRFRYDLEATLTLNKASGRIECSSAALEATAKAMLDECMDARTATDVTSIVQRILKGRGDLFPINPHGGAYFVPQQHAGLIDQVQQFLGAIGGAVNRFAVSAGNAETARSVRDSIADGIAASLAEYQAAVDAFDKDTRPDTIKRAAERIKVAKFKVEGYAALLGDQKDRLEESLKVASAQLRAKVSEIGRKMPPDEAAKPSGGGGVPAEAPVVKTGPVVAARTAMPIILEGGA